MWLHVQIYVKITALAALSTSLALAAYAQTGAVIYTCRNFYLQAFILLHSTLAAAFLTGVGNNLAFAVALGARTLIYHLTEHGVLGEAYIAGAVTFRTGFNLGAGFCTVTVAMVAGFVAIQIDFLLYAESCFFKGNFHIKAQIRTALRARFAAAATASLAAEEHIKNIIHASAAEATEAAAERITAGAAGSLRLFEGIRAKLVILLALLLIGKDAVSLIGFLEFVHGFFVALIAVRMIFQGQFTECFFYFVLGSGFAYSQYLIIISLSQNRRLLKLF